MDSFLNQVVTLLTTDAGSLTYQVVLAFSIAAAWQVAFSNWRLRESSAQGRRMAFGLGLLLFLRLALFLTGALAWQNLIDAGLWLPPLDRAITILSLVIIIWLWAFPQPQRGADTAALLVGLVTVFSLIFGVIYWTGGAGAGAFNGSYPDTLAQIFALTLIAIGLLLLGLRRLPGFGYGLAMLVILGLSHLLDLINPLSGQNFSGMLRLGQMIAYPLLLGLPLRLSLYEPMLIAPPQPAPQPAVADRFPRLDPQVLPDFLALAAESDLRKISRVITSAIARQLSADICLLLVPPDQSGRMSVLGGFDLDKDTAVSLSFLENRQAPLLSAALRRGKPLRLPANSTSPDIKGLAQAFSLNRPGHLLAIPLVPEFDPPLAGLVLLASAQKRAWSSEEQTYLEELSISLVRLLQQRKKLDGLQAEVDQVHQEINSVRSQAEAFQQERDLLLEQVSEIRRSSDQEHDQLKSLAAVLADQQELQNTLNDLHLENQALEEALKHSSSTVAAQDEHQELTGELRMALEEVAYLRLTLSQADQKIIDLQTVAAHASLTGDQAEQLHTIVEELRQPMSAIIGFIEILLAESLGILGDKQRKLLERVKAASERMAHLVDDLMRLTSSPAAGLQINLQQVKLGAAIREAATRVRPDLNQKNVALQVDLPSDLPFLSADPHAIQTILVNLILHACQQAPQGGQVKLHALLESAQGQPDFIVLQVSNNGAGYSPEELQHLFSQVYAGESQHASDPKESCLADAKSLIEAMGGRIWADSTIGQGSTFSMVLPVASGSGHLEAAQV